MKKYPICSVSELPPGQKKIVSLEGKSIGVFNIDGEFHALRNLCPHQFAPLCEGKVTGYSPPSAVGEYHWSRVGEIIRCPWHGWEFDIKTGRSVFNPHKVRTKSYEVAVGAPHCPAAADDDAAVEHFETELMDDIVYVLA